MVLDSFNLNFNWTLLETVEINSLKLEHFSHSANLMTNLIALKFQIVT